MKKKFKKKKKKKNACHQITLNQEWKKLRRKINEGNRKNSN